MSPSDSLNLASAIFVAVLTGYVCFDEIVNPGTGRGRSPFMKVAMGTSSAFCFALAAYLAARG